MYERNCRAVDMVLRHECKMRLSVSVCICYISWTLTNFKMSSVCEVLTFVFRYWCYYWLHLGVKERAREIFVSCYSCNEPPPCASESISRHLCSHVASIPGWYVPAWSPAAAYPILLGSCHPSYFDLPLSFLAVFPVRWIPVDVLYARQRSHYLSPDARCWLLPFCCDVCPPPDGFDSDCVVADPKWMRLDNTKLKRTHSSVFLTQ